MFCVLLYVQCPSTQCLAIDDCIQFSTALCVMPESWTNLTPVNWNKKQREGALSPGPQFCEL